MAGKLRVANGGAIYHVLNRGDRREPIFQSDRDRAPFLDSLTETMMILHWIAKRGNMGVAGSFAKLSRGRTKKSNNMRLCGTDPRYGIHPPFTLVVESRLTSHEDFIRSPA